MPVSELFANYTTFFLRLDVAFMIFIAVLGIF